MSPTNKELVPNRPLRGDELRQVILNDVEAVLRADCMLAPQVAYGRVSYEIRVILHFDNPSYPRSESITQSARRSDNQVEVDESLAAIEGPPPLAEPTSDQTYIHATQRDRTIESPNIARMDNELPITVVRSRQDGHSVEEPVLYPKSAAEGIAPPPVDHDVTREVKRAFYHEDGK